MRHKIIGHVDDADSLHADAWAADIVDESIYEGLAMAINVGKDIGEIGMRFGHNV
jgi:hypothetical protein